MILKNYNIKQKSVYSKIVLNNLKRERNTLSKYATLNIKGIRENPFSEKVLDKKNIRPIFFHDADKIIHSKAYSRYIDKTQVFSFFKNDHITHRTLHVQFVSKISRVIGRCLKLNEDLLEAIALGHDLGHCPLGHDGERILNSMLEKKKVGHFCHSAQSVRLLKVLENNGRGLNISLQVLDGILCHNGEMLSAKYKPSKVKNFNQHNEEYEKCFSRKNYYKKIFPMTLEGCVVRISDVISYNGRDIEDAITIKLINRNDIPRKITRILGDNNSDIINNLCMDLIYNSYDKEYLEFSNKYFVALNDLLEFNIKNIYFNKRIKTQSDKVEKMFHQLYETLLNDLITKNTSSKIYTDFLNDFSDDKYFNNTPKERIVVDFISGMTDDYIYDIYNDYFVPKNFGYSL